MMRQARKSYLFLVVIAFVSGVVFSKFMEVYFSADDFYNMYLVYGQSWGDVGKAFLFSRRPDYLFYRPLTTQLFFFVGQRLFGLQPLGYHLLSAGVFAITLFFVYRLADVLTKNSSVALFTSFFYALSASNFNRLAWVSQMQELIFGLLAILCVFFWIQFFSTSFKRYFLYSVIFFILSFTAKESAIVLLPLLLISQFFLPRPRMTLQSIQTIIPFFIIAAIYLYLRFMWIGVSLGEHYFTDFRITKVLNTLGWYILWSLGVPELFVNFKYLTPTGINPKVVHYLLTDASDILVRFGTLLVLIGFLAVFFLKTYSRQNHQSEDVKGIIFGGLWFIITLLPHLFSPFHKFPYELTVPLFGCSLMLAILAIHTSSVLSRRYVQAGQFLPILLAAVYLAATFSAIRVESWNSWVLRRGELAGNILRYLQKTYPHFPKDKRILVYNDVPTVNSILGVSRQVELAIASEKAIRLLYDDSSIAVSYEDDGLNSFVCEEQTIMLAASRFFPQ